MNATEARAVMARAVVVHHTSGCRKGVHARSKDPWAVTCPRCRKSRTVRRFWNNLRKIRRASTRLAVNRKATP